jgi:SAM-dependent methyltransferase
MQMQKKAHLVTLKSHLAVTYSTIAECKNLKDVNIMDNRFRTDYKFTDRETKSKYVWLKYQHILQSQKILDVGADKCYLKQYLDEKAEYWGIGLGGSPDQQVDLEKQPIPFGDDSFDVVLCLDVLEHLENIHLVFDELCRVSSKFVVISLPNPWADFYNMLRSKNYKLGYPMKFYGLPLEKPEDRHKWFFSCDEAEKFVQYRAKINNFNIIQMDYDGMRNEGRGIDGLMRRWARSVLFQNKDLNLKALYAKTLWVVLERKDSKS